MLPPLFGLRRNGIQADFNWGLAQDAISNFLKHIPNYEQVYYEGIRRAYAYIYDQILLTSGKEFFLDKTPRYYFILLELYKTFPEAKYIFLFRNPLAILNSIVETWSEFFLWRFKEDLLIAPQLMIEGRERVGKQALTVNYEKLVSDPERISQSICKFLGIDFESEILNYHKQTSDTWQFGDKESIYNYDKPVSEMANKWSKAIGNPIMWRLAADYLKYLGPELINQMNYAYDDLFHILESQKSLSKLAPSLTWWLNFPFKNTYFIRPLARFRKSVRKYGLQQSILRTHQYWQGKKTFYE